MNEIIDIKPLEFEREVFSRRKKPTFWESVNPLNLIQGIKDSDVEIARINAEIERIRNNSQIVHHNIDTMLQAKLAEISNAEREMETKINTFTEACRQNHEFRMKALEKLSDNTGKALECKSDTEREILRNTCSFLMNIITETMKADNKSVLMMSGSCIRMLPGPQD
ncbi:MAG: hypothetical protein WC637_10515 [Victivallales bacterium]|jgi:hypothetical protein